MSVPTGPVGTILNSYNTIEELEAEHPTGNQGDAYLANGQLYVWDPENQSWKPVGNLMGATGPSGPTGPVGTILDSYDSLADLIANHPSGNQGDAYLVAGELYVWDEESTSWKSVGNLTGPTGPAGSGAIIPFASRESVTLSSGGAGGRSEVAIIGFGSMDNFIAATDPIALNPTSGALQLAFSLPEQGTITALSVFVSVAAAGVINNTIVAQLYASQTPDNSFQPVTGTRIEMALPAGSPIGTILSENVSGLSITLPAKTRLMLVFYNTSSGTISSPILHLSGGLKIV